MRYLSDGLPGFVRPTAALAGAVPDIFFDYERSLAFFKSSGSGPSQDKNPITNASGGYAQTKSGLWVLQQPNWLRQTDAGAAYEESRINYQRNPKCLGYTLGVVGSGGVLPTNFVTVATGLSVEVVAGDPSLQFDNVGIRLFGTTGATSSQILVDGGNTITATVAQVWTRSSFLKYGGALTNIASIRQQITERDSGGSSLGSVSSAADLGLTTSFVRYNSILTTVQATTAYIQPGYRIFHTSGAAIDVTIYMAVETLELGASMTSPIIPAGAGTSSTTTRNADVATGIPITVPASWTMMIEAKPQTPTTYGTGQNLVSIDAGASTDRADIFRNSADGSFRSNLVVGNTSIQTLAAGTWAQDTLARVAVRMDVGNRRLKVSGVAGGNGVTTYTPPAWSTLYIGQRRGPAGYANSLLTKVAVWGVPLSDAAVDALAP